MSTKIGIFISIFLSLGLFALFNFSNVSASLQQEIAERERQIQELERQKQEFQQQINEKQGAAQTLKNEIFILDTQIKQLQLEIRSLDLAIQKTGIEINQTAEQIEDISQRIQNLKVSLAEFVRKVNQLDQESLLAILLKNRDLSDFFGNLEDIRSAQKKAQFTISDLKTLRGELQAKQEELSDKKTEQVGLRNIQALQKQEVDSKKGGKERILTITKGEEKRYQDLVRKTDRDIQNLRQQIQFLLGQGISLEDAVKFGQLAAIRAGIRPAFLLAILDVESGLGRNVGTGNWYDDMYSCYLRLGRLDRAEKEKAAFFSVVEKLGLDPNSVKVSAKPFYGCGGAMGPAQFLPSTWLIYESEIARLTGHNPPNPWSIEDSFMAAAINLADAGANKQTPQAEVKAANTYLSGKANCTKSICRYYSNLVLTKAAEIEKELPVAGLDFSTTPIVFIF